jgi:hypothetical protein
MIRIDSVRTFIFGREYIIPNISKFSSYFSLNTHHIHYKTNRLILYKKILVCFENDKNSEKN